VKNLKVCVFVLLALSLGLITILSACTTPTPTPTPSPSPTPTPTPEPIELRVALIEPDIPSSTGDSYKWWMNEVEKRTQGKVSFTCHWGGSLASSGEMLDAVRMGQVDIGQTDYARFAAEFPLTTIGAGPYQFHYPHAPAALGAWWQLYEEFPEFEAEFTAQNAKMLFHVAFSNLQLFSNKPVRNLADLKGLKARDSGKYNPKIFEAVGCVIVATPAPEMADALQKGLIDLTSIGFESAKLFGLHEMIDYVIFIDQGSVASLGAFLINLNTWNELPQDVQQVMLDVSGDFRQAWAEKHYEEQATLASFFKEQGVEFIEFPAADREQWLNLPVTSEVVEEWIAEVEAKGLPGRAIMERWIELEAEMEASYGPK
jgi:TRAP-type C4-dicarboxylate transport system substrate-binding protein